MCPYNDTISWLINNKIPFDELIIGNSYKLSECINHSINIFIDDKYKQCIKTQNYGIRTFIFDNPYNPKYSDISRVKSFSELYSQIIKDML